MSQTTVTVPQTVVDAVQFVDRNLTAIVGVLVVALLASIVVEVIKRKYNAKQLLKFGEEAQVLSKKSIAWLLTASTSLFTALGYVLFLLQSNQSVVSQVPYIGQGVTEALGVGYLLYNLRLNKSYKTFAAWAGKFSKSTAPNQLQPVEPQPVAADELA